MISHQVIVQLIAMPTTKRGLRVHSQLDTKKYPAGVKVSDQRVAAINLHRDEFHGDWNYSLHPRLSN